MSFQGPEWDYVREDMAREARQPKGRCGHACPTRPEITCDMRMEHPPDTHQTVPGNSLEMFTWSRNDDAAAPTRYTKTRRGSWKEDQCVTG